MSAEIDLIGILHYYLQALIFALICGVTFLLFHRTKVKGYLAISIGFTILAVGFAVTENLAFRLLAMLDINLSYWYLISLYLVYTVIYILPALLILIGFFYIYKENKNTFKRTEKLLLIDEPYGTHAQDAGNH